MKHEGEAVAADEPLVELETDKVTVEVSAPSAGVLSSIVAQEGSEVPVGALLAMLEAGAGCTRPPPAKAGCRRSRGCRAGQPPSARAAANPPAGVHPPPRPLGPVARPASARRRRRMRRCPPPPS